ncbi:Importin subunit beta-1 [Neolecta irregularis DAH-3]|uniref:Importin-95 n=1 Tax=Neolecta irregularis (strain DAH-3) TaxID=1198029 RepID=A0A1U7LNP8_NEOID|nr:Importin subunit beta-1 [Neolecta irregularis DAH-3]|eukprot:OLL24259.1 Importin subunit beta-1 [Neolecta irregularis DAH-3]
MNVGELLQNTLSTNAKLRQDAVEALELAYTNHFPAYVAMLSQELASENSPSHIRNAAGLALKNTLTAKEAVRREEYHHKWIMLEDNTKQQIKQSALQTLNSHDQKAGQSAAQYIAAISAIEVPRNEWPELMPQLVQNVSEGQEWHLKHASLQAIGYICESVDQEYLATQANAILTAVVSGARKEESNANVRHAAIMALFDSLEFVRENFEREGERNYIMQVVCEATQAEDNRIQVASFGCLVRIMQLYYDKMRFYMEKALFGLTVLGMKHDDENVALQAVEFWSTVCEEEIEISLVIQEAAEVEEQTETECFHFAKVALPEVLPVLLQLLCRQEDDAEEDEWNVSMAAGTCIQLFAQCVEGAIVPPVLGFIEGNIRSDDWKRREAGVMAFGSILEGPEPTLLEPLVQQALPVLIGMMSDQHIQVKDTTAWTLGRISDLVISAISPEAHLPSLIQALLAGLNDNARIISNCCWALMNLAEQIGGDGLENQTSLMSPYYDYTALKHLTHCSAANENNSRTSAYEALSTLVSQAAIDVLPMIAELNKLVLDRLERTIAIQSQIVGQDERNNHIELQSNLCSLLTNIIRRLASEIRPVSDRIMSILLQLLGSASKQSIVFEDVFLCVALEVNFGIYLDPFAPYLYNALQNQEEHQLCSIAVGLIGDISRALGERCMPYCDKFMQHLVENLQAGHLGKSYSDLSRALSCTETLNRQSCHVLAILRLLLDQQASSVTAAPDNAYDMVEYLNQLREGIVEAYVGIVQALKTGGKSELLLPYVQHIFGFLAMINSEPEKTETLIRGVVGLLGDLAEAFPDKKLRQLFLSDWINECLRVGRQKNGLSQQTKEVARWAREQIKRAI